MSTQPPEPETLQSWEDAFQYPLPVVRKLEQQLRTHIDENRQRLRSLVGISYRDLLGTAEKIIEMDEQIITAERYMGEIGRKCSARVLERVEAGNRKMSRGVRKEEGQERRMGIVAQTRVLQNAIAVCGRIVRGGGDALVGAKVLILGRLVHKSLVEGGGKTEQEEEVPAVVEELRRKLGQMRKRLLGYISRSLVRADGDKMGMVRTLCAYALITSSAPKDVLRYFLQVRFEQLETKAEMPSEGVLLEMLDLYSQTLFDTREGFPRRFAESLAQLSKVALVRDQGVRAISELSLDVYEQWIAQDVRNFYPWVRHDQNLSTTEVGDALASWAKQAQACLLQGLSETLRQQNDPHAVLATRKKMLSKYLSLSTKLRSDSHVQAVNDIRAAFLNRLEELAVQAAQLADIGLDAQESTAGSTAPEMWDLSTGDMDLSNGAIVLRKEVIRRRNGRDSATQGVADVLDQWIGRQAHLGEAIASMRATKWDDDLDLDLEEMPDGESLQVILSKQDPRQLESVLRRETTAAMQGAYRKVEQSSESIADPALLLRILREVDQRRRNLEDRLQEGESVAADGNFVAATQRRQAMSIAEDLVSQYSTALRRGSRTPTALWDGSPPLPIQPTANTFRFLQALHRKMSGAGNDLWSPAAVHCLKLALSEKLKDQVSLERIDSAKAMTLTNGHAEAPRNDADAADSENALDGEHASPVGSTTNDFLVQHMFDFLYLQCVVATGHKGDGELSSSIEAIRGRVALDATGYERMRKGANDYWKKTYLLFGLLAVVGHPL
ncbi:Hypothetical predicted protein [Lecanosticta acicola]|uniref:Conserved oligomeric Golgi complex subunit 1 n=1 Tax=Lecanosticta acicola TaxID=111012 RepID=A0AAI8YTI4_9PEZI|nr:Hypothetical predicted protein [Lecanosticta acicola]